MSEEWLDFIATCRSGKSHDYDIVEGPMADDTIWNFVNEYLSGNISKKCDKKRCVVLEKNKLCFYFVCKEKNVFGCITKKLFSKNRRTA